MDRIVAVKCESYSQKEVYNSVKKAIDLLGGLGFKKGKKVLIKPNLLGPYPPEKAVTTHPAVIEALIKVFQKEGLEVFLGESSGFRSFGSTKKAFEVSGMKDVAERNNVRLVDFDTDDHINFNLKGKISGKISHLRISKRLTEMDYIVNVPKLKTHNLTGYTGAIKNMFGIIPGRMKTSLHGKGKTAPDFSKILVDIYQTITPHLNIMDAVVGMDGRGPAHGTPQKTGLIFASFNGAALDYVVSRTIGFDPLKIDMIWIAKERGLFNDVEVVGDGKEIKINYKLPASRGLGSFSFISRFMKPTFQADEGKCRRCYQCVNACPERAISVIDKFPVWDKNKCITCYCCDELCPTDAIILKKPLLAKIIDSITGRYK